MSVFTTLPVDSIHPGMILPEHLAWDFEIKGNVLDSIRSKKKRKFLKNSSSILLENSIVEKVLPIESEEKFTFLLNFFQKSHEEKKHNYGLNTDWYRRNSLKMRKLESLELWKGNELVGMKMYSYDESGFFLSHKASLKKYDLQINLGMILDYLSFLRAEELGYIICNVGKDSNLFGIHMQLSLYEYKVSFGMKLRMAKRSVLEKIYFPPGDTSKSFVAYIILNDKEKLFLVHSNTSKIEDVEKYKPINLEISPVLYNDFCLLQK